MEVLLYFLFNLTYLFIERKNKKNQFNYKIYLHKIAEIVLI